MSSDLSDLRKWRDALFEARLRGVRRVRDSTGEEVEYRSDAEISRALAAVDRAIAEAEAGRSRPILSIRFNTSKGL